MKKISIKEFFIMSEDKLQIKRHKFFINFLYQEWNSENCYVYTRWKNGNEVKHIGNKFVPNIFLFNNNEYEIYFKLDKSILDFEKFRNLFYNYKEKYNLEDSYFILEDEIYNILQNSDAYDYIKENVKYCVSTIKYKNNNYDMLMDFYEIYEKLKYDFNDFYINFSSLYDCFEEPKPEIKKTKLFFSEENIFYIKLKYF